MSAAVDAEPTEPDMGTEEASARPHPIRQLGMAAFWLVVMALVALAIALVGVPAVVGGQALLVKSGSMEPTLPVGSAAVIREQPVESIERGDVITFTDPDADNRLVTHRVVEVNERGEGLRFVTKGDANEDPDPGFVPAKNVRGVLWYEIPWVGTVRDLVVSPAGAGYGLGLVLLIFAAHQLVPKNARKR